MKRHNKKNNLNPSHRERAEADNQNKEISKLQKEIDELKTGWQRTQADFDNFCKRTNEERNEILDFQKADFMTSIVPVLDNFRRAFEHAPQHKSDTDWVQGVRQIEKQLEEILTSEGLKKIPAELGIKFEPELHEAISCEINNEVPADFIISEIESGWEFRNKVLKPAKVRVSKGK